jgi:poly(3-hydroxybutyrate) depolymerase
MGTSVLRPVLDLATTLLVAGAPLAVAAEPDSSLPLGQVVERVSCRDNSVQSYALYLPSGYRPDRPWPILYAFDPAARGRVPVELFSKAAERLGYIVVGSNNSRNGPGEPVVAAMNALWSDTHARFVLDPERIYATGMSGGNYPARLLLAQRGAGMVACAGAFVEDDIANVEPRHTWIAIAGVSDFNVDLNRAAVRALVARGVVARFVTFDGGHSWPPEAVVSQALDWLELGAMRNGQRPPDPTFVEAQFEGGLARARALVAGGQVHDAADESATLVREFAGLKPAGTLQALAREADGLGKSPEAKKARKREQSLARDEKAQGDRLRSLRWRLEQDPREQMQHALSQATDDPMALWDPGATRRELDDLLKRLARDLDSAQADRRIVSKRVIDGFYIDTLYQGQQHRDQRRLVAAQADFEICIGMRPKASAPVYDLARTHAAQGDRKQALARLRSAMELGFRDLGRLDTDPEWAPLHEQPEFQAIASEKSLDP